jgi:DNA-3-methyladenine glycosylase
VLLRALEPLEGIAAMSRARGGNAAVQELARGPGRLCTAMGVDHRHDGLDLCEHQALFLAGAVRPPGPIGESARIGISKEAERVLRFYERGNRCVSGPSRLRA